MAPGQPAQPAAQPHHTRLADRDGSCGQLLSWLRLESPARGTGMADIESGGPGAFKRRARGHCSRPPPRRGRCSGRGQSWIRCVRSWKCARCASEHRSFSKCVPSPRYALLSHVA
jgi:hypothetical protein